MKKKVLLMVMAGLAVFSFSGCTDFGKGIGNVLHADEMKKESIVIEKLEEVDRSWNKNVARRVTDDGWVYTFGYTYREFGVEEEDLIQYTFSGVNLRYRYSDIYYEVQAVEPENPSMATELLPRNMLSLGSPEYPALNRDMDKIMEILDYGNYQVTRAELLELKPENVEFEELDKDMFFSLMHEALNGSAHKEGNYGLQSNSILTEELYSGNYKFQVGYASEMGVVDIIYIDVLYKTGNKYNDYIQLYDLVKEDKASDKQIEAYKVIMDIEKGIVENNNFMYGYEENGDKNIGGIDFYRLYKLLSDMHNGKIY